MLWGEQRCESGLLPSGSVIGLQKKSHIECDFDSALKSYETGFCPSKSMKITNARPAPDGLCVGRLRLRANNGKRPTPPTTGVPAVSLSGGGDKENDNCRHRHPESEDQCATPTSNDNAHATTFSCAFVTLVLCLSSVNHRSTV